VLVVAADDGVMPQTIEAINHAKAAGAPMIVAINKIDKPEADANRVINELLQHEIVVESLGGDTQAVEVSATQKTGLDSLIEAILLQAEVMDLKANPDRSADGVVIEAKLDRGRGVVATVLVKRGALKRADIVVAGANWGRVRALINERDEQVDAAGPSEPVEVLGLDGTPDPGEPFAVVENEARARELLELVGLTNRATHFVHQLSGGEQQRTAIARALVHRPSLLIADEPTGNLDTASAGRVLALLRQIANEQLATLILVTHSAEVAAAASRQIELRDGKVVADRFVAAHVSVT